MKKVLAWAVVLALVLSSFTMAFADQTKTSKDFKDGSQIQYTEAVDVMVATGVINGYPDGTFGPQKTVKRSEMAKMISVMLNAGKDIGDQYKDACTFGDSKDHWAAGYIAYCAAQHIIDGRSADVFDPEKEVTGTEVAKMALTSLGYDSKIQGYTGSEWAANVLKDANKIDLFAGLKDFTPGDPCSREAAAQILFNTLQATKVEYDNGTSVSVGDDVNVVVSSKIKDVTEPKSKDQQEEGEDGYGTIQLWEDVFGSDLQKDSDGVKDDFGRPSHTWEYQGDKVGTYDDDADETFVTEKDFDSVAAAIADYNKDYTSANATFYVNGVLGDVKIPAGTTVELTKSKKNVTYVVAYYYQLMQIDAVETEVSAKDAEDGVSAYVTVAGIEGAINDTDFPGYEAEAYVADAYIAVCTDGAKVLDSYVPETKQGEITKFSKDSVFVDGTAYYMAGKDTTYVAGAETAAKAGDTVDLYLDKAGNALGTIVAKADEPEYLYGVLRDVVVSGGQSIKDHGELNMIKKASFTIFDADGAEKSYTLSADAKAALDELNKENPDPEKAAIGEDIMSAVGYLGYAYEEQDLDGIMIKYSLAEDGTLDTMTMDYDDDVTASSMDEDGIMDGKQVSEDIVIFAYDAEEEAWVIFDYNDLANAEEDSISGEYFENGDGDIVALWAEEGLVATPEDTFGFFLSEEPFTVSDGTYYTVEMYVDGKKAEYDTTATIGADYAIAGSEVGTPIVVSISDNKITKAKVADFEQNATPKESFTANKDGVKKFEDFTVITEVKGTSLAFDDTGLIGTAGAQAYKMSYDKDGEIVFAPYSGSYKEGGAAMLYQTSSEKAKWNVVVYMTAADYEKYTAPEEPPVVGPTEPLDPEYEAVVPQGTENPSDEGWYELVDGEYVETTDEVVVEGKTYYAPKEEQLP